MKCNFRVCRSFPLAIISCGIIVVATTPARNARQLQETHRPPLQIAKLIKKLGDDHYEVRELAQKAAAGPGRGGTPALRRAADIARQRNCGATKQILQGQAERRATAWLARLAGHAKRGEVDLLVEQVVHDWNPYCDRTAWEVVCTLLHDLLHAEKLRFPETKLTSALANWSNLAVPCTDPGHYLKTTTLFEIFDQKSFESAPQSGKYLARLAAINASQRFPYSLALSAGSVNIADPGLFWQAVVLANDAVTSCALGSVVICDGDFQAQANFTNSLVIARGRVTITADMYRSLIVCGGSVHRFTDVFSVRIHNSVIVTTSTVGMPERAFTYNTSIKEKQAAPFGFIRFFDPTAAGIEVAMHGGAVRIKTVDPAKSFGKAGLKAGDAVLTIDESPITSVVGFRKDAAQGLAVERNVSFEIRRAGKVLTVNVKNPY